MRSFLTVFCCCLLAPLFVLMALLGVKAVPQGRIRCWERAAKGSFFARENACNFINFSRKLGIHENLLFESEDLGKRIFFFSLFFSHCDLLLLPKRTVLSN